MNRQKMVDFVVEKLAGQNFVQSAESGTCLYRGPNERKCAAGWLIPDELYSDDLEGKSIGTLFGLESVKQEILDCLLCSDDFSRGFTTDKLQRIHDGCSIPQDMIENFRMFYLEYHLDTTKFEQVVRDYQERTQSVEGT